MESTSPQVATSRQDTLEGALRGQDEPAAAELFYEPQSRFRIPLPAGVGVDVKHFDPTLPAYKFRHLVELHTPQGVAVIIEVWDNPTRQPLEGWFSENMGFLLDGHTRVSQREVTTSRVQAFLLEQPRSPMAISLGFAVFAAQARVYRVSVIDADAELSLAPRALFEAVLDRMELEVAP
ncbi:MAG: hypothetical protein AMXMBFR34_24410 [Myxococcaceae bacterium]